MTTHYHPRGFSYLFVFFALFGMLTTACEIDRANEAKPSLTVKKVAGQSQYVFSGEAIYRGLFFTQGPVAEKLPTLTAQMPTVADIVQNNIDLDSLYSIQDRIIAGVKDRHPAFFDSLQTVVYSRNPVDIRHQIAVAAQYTQETFVTLPEYKANRERIEALDAQLSSVDMHQFAKPDGSFDKEKFKEYAQSVLGVGAGGVNGQNLMCIFFGVVFVAWWGVFIFGGFVAGAYLFIGAVIGVYRAAAVYTEAYTPAITSNPEPTLFEEILISELANNVGVAYQ